MAAGAALDVGRNLQDFLVLLGLQMSRMLVAFSVIPLFAGGAVPALVRTALVASLAFSLLPLALADTAATSMPLSNVFIYALKEAAIGLVLGLLSSIGFWAMYVAGTIVEYQAGLSMATTVDPLMGREDSLIGGLFVQLFSIVFLIAGGLLGLIGMLFESYKVWPLASMAPVVGNLKLAEVALRGLSDLLILAVKIAAPFLILMLVIELALGLLSRFAPQLNVFFLALPLKVGVLAGLLLLYGAVMSGSLSLWPIADFRHWLDLLRGI